VHQRAFARARRPHNRGELVSTNFNVDSVEGGNTGVAIAVDFGQSMGAGCNRHPLTLTRI